MTKGPRDWCATMSTLYCKVYVDAECDGMGLLSRLQTIFGGSIERRTLRSTGFELDVSENEEFDSSARGSDCFLYSRFLLDVEAAPTASRPQFVESVARLLHSFWELDVSAVAACDFEDELPKRGP